MKRDDGGPAFPSSAPESFEPQGMALRDWFASQAPPQPAAWVHWWDSWIANSSAEDRPEGWGRPEASEVAWRWAYADAMLAARKA